MKLVEYVGMADAATVTDEQFGKAGADSRTVKWKKGGEPQEVSEEAAEVLAKDGRFKVSDVPDYPEE